MTPTPDTQGVDSQRGHDEDEKDTSQASAEDEASDSSSIDTDAEIAISQLPARSKKTAKRKRRAVSPTPFGLALTSLLETSTLTSQPLALRPSIAKNHDDQKLEMRAKKLLQNERRLRDERGRVKDVIGGWGGEKERMLRKVAQRGVVKLFNMIQEVQTTEDTQPDSRNTKHFQKRGVSSRKPNESRVKETKKDERVQLDQDDFMNMIRSGGVVSTR